MMLNAEGACDVLTQSLHAVALGGVMSTGKIGNTTLARQVDGRLGDLTAQIDLRACSDRVAKKTLRRTGTPPYRSQLLRRVTY